MTRSNRILNRVLLAVLGVVAVALGSAVATVGLPSIRGPVDRVVTIPRSVRFEPDLLWIVAAGCLVVAVIALLWTSTRGRGGTAVAVREQTRTNTGGAGTGSGLGTGAGSDSVTVNVALLRDVVEHELRGAIDVVGARVDTYRARGGSVARIRVAVRRGGDAVAALAAVDTAVGTLDRMLGRRLPLLVHLTAARVGHTAAARVR